MSLKIRLQRQGKKKQAFYHVVVADSRSPRDGRYVERLGTYNPRFDLNGLDIDNERTVQWLEKGALPTDSCRNLLSDRGLLYKKHLNRGIRKGVITQEQADANFAKWLAEKEKEQAGRKEKTNAAANEAHQQRVAAEKAAKEAKSKAIAEKKAAVAEAAAKAEAPVAPTETPAEAPKEAPAEGAAPEAAPQA